MKLFKVTIVALFALCMGAQAQEKAIGIRFGSGNVSGAELTYQMPFGGETNRLQLDFGVGLASDSYYGYEYSYFQTAVTGTYQWVFPIANVDGLAWFVGPGASLGFWSESFDYSTSDNISDNGISFAIGGIGGVEYTLTGVPLQFSLDSRPMINLVGNDDYRGNWGVAASIRYVL